MRASAFWIVFAWGAVALADPTKHECIAADTQAQTFRGQGKFHDARAQLAVCTQPACPQIVRQDCTERLDEVNRIQPSLVFDVKDSSGHDVTDATVTIDGAPLLDHIVAESVQVDPGEHDLVVDARGHISNKLHVLVHEGDKDRRIAITVGTPAPVVAQAPPPAITETSSPPTSSTTTAVSSGSGERWAGVLLGATGLVGLALGGAFAGAAFSNWQSAENACSPSSCPSATRPDAQSAHDSAVTLAAASTAAFIAGGVLAAAGIVVYLIAPRRREAAAAWLRVTPTGLGFGGRFR